MRNEKGQKKIEMDSLAEQINIEMSIKPLGNANETSENSHNVEYENKDVPETNREYCSSRRG